MPYFTEQAEVEHFIGGIFTECVNAPELKEQFAATGVIMQLHFTDPDATVVVDFVDGKVYTEDGAGPKPNIEMFMTSDVGHQYWLGKVNVSVALAKGQMRAKGPVPKILKLVPLTKHVFPRYQQMIEDANRPELLQPA
jgi:putative sterol carrier protein